MMNDIVTIGANNAPVTTSLVIAEGTTIQHKNVLQLIRKNINDLQELGPIAFETRKGSALPQGGFARSTEIAILNEQQATLVFTYMRNTEPVKKFKLALVKAFFEMAKKLREQSKPQAPALPDFTDPAAAAIAWAEQYRQKKALEAQIEEDRPKVEFAEDIIGSNSEMVLTPAGQSIGLGQRKFFDLMRRHNFMCQDQYRITEFARQKGYMKMKPRILEDGVTIKLQPVLLGKGLFKLYQLALAEGLIERNPQIEMSMQ